MSEFVRDIYIPEYDKNLVHLKLLSPGQKPHEFDPKKDLGRVFSIFDLLTLGKGRIQEGLDTGFNVIESQRKDIYSDEFIYASEVEGSITLNEEEYGEDVFSKEIVYAPELERNLTLTKEGNYIVAVSEVIKSAGKVQDVFTIGDEYSWDDLVAAGEGNAIEGINKLHKFLEDKISEDDDEPDDVMLVDGEEVFSKKQADINTARWRLDPEDNRPLSEEIIIYSAPKDSFRINH